MAPSWDDSIIVARYTVEMMVNVFAQGPAYGQPMAPMMVLLLAISIAIIASILGPHINIISQQYNADIISISHN